MAGIFFESGFNYLQLERDLQRGKMSVGDFVRENERAGRQIDSLWKNAGTAVAAYFTFDVAKNIGSQIIEVRGQMQQLTVAFTTMLGSKEKADTLMQQMVNTAASTPFSLTQVADGAKRLLAYGISAETVNDTLVKLGNAASGVSVPLDRMILAYGQVKAKGKLQGDDMRQFMEMGLPLVHQLAMQFGVADSEISKMVESGKVGFSAVEQAINSMTGAGGQFYNLMQEQSKTIPGMISNLGDSIDQMFNKLGTDNQGTIEGTIGLLSLMVENYQLFINILKIAVAAYGTYKAAVIAVSIAEKVRYQMTLAQMASTQGLTTLQAFQAIVIGKVKDAQAMLNKTMLANPYALAAAAIIALVATLVLFSDNATAAEKAAKKLGDITKDAADGAKEERVKIDALISTIRSEVTTREQKNDALKKLNDIMPDNLGYITEEAVRTGKATAAIDTYIRSVERQIKIDAIKEEMKQSQQRIMGAGRDVGFGTSVWNTIKTGGNAALGQALAIVDISGDEFKYQQALMKDLTKLTEEGIVVDNKVSQSKKRTISVIDAEIKQKKDEQQAVATTSAEYKAYEQQIKKLEAEREGISGGKKSGKAVADATAYREQLYKVYSEINKNKETLMKDGFDKEMSTIKNAYSDQLAAVSKQEADLLVAYNKSKGLKKGDKSYISQLPEEAKDAIDKLRALAEQAKAAKELSLFFGEGKDQIVEDISMDALLESTKTFEQKRLDIVGQAMLEIATLENKGLTDQAAVRRKKMKGDVGELEASHRTELKSWAYLYENIDKWGKKALLARVAMLKEDAKVSKITAEEKLAIDKALADTEAELAKKGPLDALKIINENIEKAKKKVVEAKTLAEKQKAQGELDTETAKKGAILSDTFSTVAGHLQGIAGIVGQVNEGLGEAIDNANQMANAISQLASGNYVGAAISFASTIVSTIAKSKKEAEIQAKMLVDVQLNALRETLRLYNEAIGSAKGLDTITATNAAIEKTKNNIKATIDLLGKAKLIIGMNFFDGNSAEELKKAAFDVKSALNSIKDIKVDKNTSL
jgi:tape measure domain-containing protein